MFDDMSSMDGEFQLRKYFHPRPLAAVAALMILQFGVIPGLSLPRGKYPSPFAGWL